MIAAGKAALDSHGAGLSSVRFICGTQDIHRELEKKITQFHGRDDAILYAACFDANAGIFEVMLSTISVVYVVVAHFSFRVDADDAVISDELNHASIIDGVRLCKAQRHRFKHMDLNDLESILKETQSERCLLES